MQLSQLCSLNQATHSCILKSIKHKLLQSNHQNTLNNISKWREALWEIPFINSKTALQSLNQRAKNTAFNAVKVHRTLKKTPKLCHLQIMFSKLKLCLEIQFIPIWIYRFYKFKCLKFQNVTSKLGEKPTFTYLMNLFISSL